MSLIKTIPIYFLYVVGIFILNILFDILSGINESSIGNLIWRTFLFSVIMLAYSAFKPKKVV